MQWNVLKLVGSTGLASKVVLFLLCSLCGVGGGRGGYLTSLHLSSLMYKIRETSDVLPEGKEIRSDVSVNEGSWSRGMFSKWQPKEKPGRPWWD